MQTTIRKEEKEGGEGERTDTSGLGRVVLAVFETRAARGTASSPRLRRIRISLCPLYRIPLSRQPIQTRYPNESFVVRGPGIYIYIYIYVLFAILPLHVHVQGIVCTLVIPTWAYNSVLPWNDSFICVRLIESPPSATFPFSFSPRFPPCPSLYPSPPSPSIIRASPSLFDTGLPLLLFPPSADTNAVSCFNFPSPRKTERRARHPPCPIHPRRFYFSLPPPNFELNPIFHPLVKRFHGPIRRVENVFFSFD